MFALDGGESADPRGDEHADRVSVGGRDLEPGIVDRKLRGRERVLDEDVDFLDVLLPHEVQRVESLDLTGNARGELGRVEMGDGANAALAGAERAPVRFGPDADRRNQADAGDDHSPAQGQSYFFLASASMYSMASFTRVIF